MNISFYTEWKQIFEVNKCNWYTLTPISVIFEYEAYCGEMSLNIVLLGFGLYLSHTFNTKQSRKFAQKINKRLKEVKSDSRKR